MVVAGQEQMRAMASLGNGAPVFKWSVPPPEALHPGHPPTAVCHGPKAPARALCMQNSLTQSLIPNYSDHPLLIFFANYTHNFALVKICLMHNHVVKWSYDSTCLILKEAFVQKRSISLGNVL